MTDEKEKLEPLRSVNHKIFVREYVLYRNATRAYMLAYPKSTYNTARTEGSKLLAKPNIKAHIAAELGKIREKYKIDLEDCVFGLSRIAHANMLHYINPLSGEVDLSNLSFDQAAAIKEITVDTYEERTGFEDETEKVKRIKIKLHDSKSAFLELGKHFGGFKTKVEHSGTVELADRMKEARERAKDKQREYDRDWNFGK